LGAKCSDNDDAAFGSLSSRAKRVMVSAETIAATDHRQEVTTSSEEKGQAFWQDLASIAHPDRLQTMPDSKKPNTSCHAQPDINGKCRSHLLAHLMDSISPFNTV